MIRLKAIIRAIVHGILPSRLYERERHYNCSYWQHLLINIRYALRWMLFREYESDREFEKQVNNNA